MSEQINLWYTGVYDNAGLDYFEPATSENQLFAIRRAKGINEHNRNAKAFSVPLSLRLEETILDLLKIGEIQMAKIIITAQDGIQYVK